METPFHHHVPKEIIANLKWRKRALERVRDDPSYAEVLVIACQKDPLFFVDAFAWTYNPKEKRTPKLPFILYEYQENALLELLRSVNNNDLLLEKSRDMGASWLCITASFWRWMFRDYQSFLFVSRTENYVDELGNPKSLFWKFDFLYDNLPPWLKIPGYDPNQHRRKLHIENPANGSVVDGESTTGNVARGDRRTAILLDEFAAVEQGHRVLRSTRDATDCRWFNSTPAGTNNAFYDMRQTNIRKLRLHWSSHPIKAAGLYTTTKDGNLEVLDSAGYPANYKPILDGKLRSPWYDLQCERAGSSQEIAQELDIDYLGSAHQFFNSDKVQEAIAKFARPPVVVGNLDYDWATGDPIGFERKPRAEGGRAYLWCMIDGKGNPLVSNKVIMSADVAMGTGASNSCLVAYDSVTREKVLEYASPYIRPEHFAVLTVAFAKWFKGIIDLSGYDVETHKTPRLIWESNGPGRQYGAKVLELGFNNIYLRTNDISITHKVSDIPGFPPTKESKVMVLGEYRAAVEGQQIINRSKTALEETLEYVFLPNGGVAHAKASDKLDPSGAAANHGDRVMADAMAWKMFNVRTIMKTKEEPEVPVGCMAWRRKMREQDKQPKTRELGAGW